MPPIRRTRTYIGEALVVEHAPDGPVRATAILVLPPLGYEDTCAYRPLRVLADALAEAGHTVQRLDWPGLGDSGGDGPDLVARQIAAARTAIAAFRGRGFPRVAGIGVRAGGLLALEAGGFDELVLWGVPATGRAFLREERAFHRMAARHFEEREPVPGTVEAGGFVYDVDTVTALDALAPRVPEHARVIPRASGIGDLLEDPYRSVLNAEVRDRIVGGFGEEDRFVPTPLLERSLDLGAIVERPWVHPGLSGIVCEPRQGRGPGSPGGPRAPQTPGAAWTLFFNAGGVRRSGPNRLWTRAARALAAEGRPSLRMDVRDVGDSDGSSLPHHDLEEMYSEASIADAVSAWDAVSALGAGTIDVVGLCSGAFLGIQVAARRAVRRAVLFNCLAYVWDDEARSNGVTRQIGRSLLDRRRWLRLLGGRIDAVAVAQAVARRGRLRVQGRPPDSPVDRLLREVGAVTDLHLVSSEGDPSIDYLARHVPVERRPRVTLLSGVDHTIRPAWAHARVIELVCGPRV